MLTIKSLIMFCFFQVNNQISIENFVDFAQLGRFTLRTEGEHENVYYYLQNVDVICMVL